MEVFNDYYLTSVVGILSVWVERSSRTLFLYSSGISRYCGMESMESHARFSLILTIMRYLR